jgi:hypothetical protein
VPAPLTEFFELLEKTSWSVSIRQSTWLYPALEIVHILGIVMVVGAAFMFDLRLLGYGRDLEVSGLSKHLLPWSQRGLILVIPSGILLFLTNAQSLGTDPVFWLKLILLVAAAVNVLIFHKFIFTKERGNRSGNLPFPAKISALVSITVWIAIIACGRLLAY